MGEDKLKKWLTKSDNNKMADEEPRFPSLKGDTELTALHEPQYSDEDTRNHLRDCNTQVTA